MSINVMTPEGKDSTREHYITQSASMLWKGLTSTLQRLSRIAFSAKVGDVALMCLFCLFRSKAQINSVNSLEWDNVWRNIRTNLKAQVWTLWNEMWLWSFLQPAGFHAASLDLPFLQWFTSFFANSMHCGKAAAQNRTSAMALTSKLFFRGGKGQLNLRKKMMMGKRVLWRCFLNPKQVSVITARFGLSVIVIVKCPRGPCAVTVSESKMMLSRADWMQQRRSFFCSWKSCATK